MAELTIRDVGILILNVERVASSVADLWHVVVAIDSHTLSKFGEELAKELGMITHELQTIAESLAGALPQTNLLEREENGDEQG